MVTQPVRLVTTASAIASARRADDEYYDASLGYTVASTLEGIRPVAEIAAAARTMSKTAQAPGDDDDDPDREACY